MSERGWRLRADEESTIFYKECAALSVNNQRLIAYLRQLLADHSPTPHQQTLDSGVELLHSVVESYRAVTTNILPYEATTPSADVVKYPLNPTSAVHNEPLSTAVLVFKTRRSREKLWQERLTLVYLVHQLVGEMINCVGEEGQTLRQIFRLSCYYNELLTLGAEDKGIATSCKNTCPILLQPLRKLSITRLLQIAAQRRAEHCCHRLTQGLLRNYRLHTHPNLHSRRPKKDTPTASEMSYSDELTSSDENSSIEIYRALTGYLTPPFQEPAVSAPVQKLTAWPEKSEFGRLDWALVEALLEEEENHVTSLLNIAANVTPQLLGKNGVKISKNSGLPKVYHSVRNKAIEYYQQVLWGEAGGYMEHYVLWWSTKPYGPLAPNSSQQLRSWVVQLATSGTLPAHVAPAINNLGDGLGCHVTATKWDELFRHTLVHGQRQGSDDKEKDVGQLFVDLLRSLVSLSNQCETTSDWLYSPPLEELPLVEQIPILHRLDHSVHTTRLWAANKARTLVNMWKVDKFFEVSQTEMQNCLSELCHLKMAEHTNLTKVDSQHVLVCAKMRTKLTTEVNENVTKLKKLPSECLDVMASVCMTFSLANLHMCFPEHKYWKQTGPLPDTPSNYVKTYLDRVMKPVLLSLSPLSIPLQQSISRMTLRIMCEAWLDHIYTHKIKFSDWGAMQLLADFAGVPKWLEEQVELPTSVLQTLLTHEVLRRCEGVGRLLLRKPGEHIAMVGKSNIKNNQVGVDGSPQTQQDALETLPAEMFVPNQQQWLQLRASKPRAYSLCCSS